MFWRLRIFWRDFKWKIHDKVIRSLIFSFIGALVVSSLTYSDSSFYAAKPDNVLYFLSSVSQGLAAVFALVFTISIFGAQMMGRFTALDRMMDKWTKLYMILFTLGIILPLLQLKMGIYSIDLVSVGNIDLLAIDLFLVVFCVLGIIPYLIKINRITKYQGGILKLNEEARDAIDSKNVAIASYRVIRLNELCLNALDDSLPDEAMSITTMIRTIGNLSVEKELETPVIQVVKGFQNLGITAMDKKTIIGLYPVPWQVIEGINTKMADFPIAWNLINGLREMCIGGIDKNFDEQITLLSCSNLFEISYKYLLKIRNYFVKMRFTSIVPLIDPVGLIIGGRGIMDNQTLVEILLEIAEKSTKKKEDLFCWNHVPGKDSDKINKF
ncbi:hypothetical protein, partial [Methanosarcina sp.]|uniref:hypothetical protein n=1 Tax=Methanosarcina sp. TaxID=2213 RepID=UPI002AB83370